MSGMARFGVFLGLMAIAVLAAAAFGALHNQVSYTVGPDYFHTFKFRQFTIPREMAPRLGAMEVGILASWWMGVLMGLPPLVLGLFTLRPAGRYWRAGLRAIALAVGVTALTALAGLLFGLVVVTPETAAQVPLPVETQDPVGFLRAGAMHDASYLGGVLGMLAAVWLIWRSGRTGR